MSWRRCASKPGTPDLQLKKLQVRRLPVDGRRVDLPFRRGYVEAVAVVVPASGRVQVTPFSGERTWSALLLPDGITYTSEDCWTDRACEEPWTSYLEAGRPLGGIEGPFATGPRGETTVLEARDRILYVAGAVGLVARTTTVARVAVDGPQVDFGDVRLSHEVALEVDLTAGQWFRLDRVGTDGDVRPDLVLSDGSQVPAPWVGYGVAYWQAPVTGTYRVLLRRWWGTDRPVPIVAGLRSMRAVSTPLPTDGTPVDYQVTTPGEWVVAPVTGSGQVQLSGSGSEGALGWFASAETSQRFYCDIYGPLGCGDLRAAYANADNPVPTFYFDKLISVDGPAVAVVGMTTDATGTVTARLTPAPGTN